MISDLIFSIRFSLYFFSSCYAFSSLLTKLFIRFCFFSKLFLLTPMSFYVEWIIHSMLHREEVGCK